MGIDFGLLLAPGSLHGQHSEQWLRDLDASLPLLEGHLKSLWMSDHLFWEDKDTHEAWTVLAFLAARFPKFDVGPSVLGQSYRNPALLAKMGATLQVLSGGRLIMAIGAGWKANEYLAYNYPYPRAGIRIEQLEDTLEIIKRLWTEPGKVSYHGKHYRIIDAYCEPKPDPIPPFLVGGGGQKTMMLAARYADLWNLSDEDVAGFIERRNILKRHCDTIGRDLSTLRLSWLGRLSVASTEAEARERALTMGRDHYSGWSVEKALVGTPQQVIDKMNAFIEAGVDYFMLDIISLPNPDIIGMVVEEVLPKVRR